MQSYTSIFAKFALRFTVEDTVLEKPKSFILAFFVFASFISSNAMAADLATSDTPAPPPSGFDDRRFGGLRDKLSEWKVTVGVGAVFMPVYEGSDEFDLKPIPIFPADFGDRVHLDTRGLVFDVIETNGLRLGVKAGYELGRKEDDSKYLRGLGDVDAGAVVGLVGIYEQGPFQLYSALDKSIGGSEGLTGTFGAKVSRRWESFIFSAEHPQRGPTTNTWRHTSVSPQDNPLDPGFPNTGPSRDSSAWI